MIDNTVLIALRKKEAKRLRLKKVLHSFLLVSGLVLCLVMLLLTVIVKGEENRLILKTHRRVQNLPEYQQVMYYECMANYGPQRQQKTCLLEAVSQE